MPPSTRPSRRRSRRQGRHVSPSTTKRSRSPSPTWAGSRSIIRRWPRSFHPLYMASRSTARACTSATGLRYTCFSTSLSYSTIIRRGVIHDALEAHREQIGHDVKYFTQNGNGCPRRGVIHDALEAHREQIGHDVKYFTQNGNGCPRRGVMHRHALETVRCTARTGSCCLTIKSRYGKAKQNIVPKLPQMVSHREVVYRGLIVKQHNHVPTERIFVMEWSAGSEYRKLRRGKHKVKGKYDPERHHRHSIRLESYNYSQQGAYFVTICTQNRQCFFGNIVDGNISFSDVGEMVLSQWKMLPERFAPVVLDEYVLMPNHLHGIIYLSSSEGEHTITPPNEWQPRTFQRPARNTLGEIVRSFKAATARLVR